MTKLHALTFHCWPLLSASISTAAGNSHKLAYFELSKASVAAGLYKAAKSCYSISGHVLRNHTDGFWFLN